MVTQTMISFWLNLFFKVFDFIKIPDFPESLQESLDKYLDLIFNGINLFGFFVRPQTIQIVIPLIIIIINFDKIYKLTMWILKKIPILNIK